MKRGCRTFFWMFGLSLASGAAVADGAYDCVDVIAERFAVPSVALTLILDVEGGTLGAASINKNRSLDLGPAQINTTHWRRGETPEQDGILRRANVDPRLVRDDPCINLAAAAAILKLEYRASGSWTEAMVRYHHPTNTTHQARYRGLLLKAAERRRQRGS